MPHNLWLCSLLNNSNCIKNTTFTTYSLLESSQSSEFSFNSLFPGSLFSKSTSCVIVTGGELSDTLTFIKPTKPKIHYIYVYIFVKPQLLTFDPELFTVGTQIIVNTNWTNYAHRLQIQRFQFFWFFLTLCFLSASFLFDNLITTFLQLFLVLSQWQSSSDNF